MLAGGGVAAALGQDAVAAAGAAQNETLNNCLGRPESCCHCASKVGRPRSSRRAESKTFAIAH